MSGSLSRPSGPTRPSRPALRRRHPSRAGLAVAAVVGLAALAVPGLSAVGAASAAPPDLPAPAVAERYIVVLAGSDDPGAVAAAHAALGARADLVYRTALRGYAGTMSPAAAARVAADPRVAYVEKDQLVQAFDQVLPTGVDRISLPDSGGADAAQTGIDGVDDKRVDVDVAVIDSGIDATHPDLNVVGTTDCASGSPFSSACVDGSGTDGNGHGTHVAGTIGALDNGIGVVGVAPGARLWAVRVLNSKGSGYMSWIAAGIDWVTRKGGIEAANMSLGCECTSAAVSTALANSIAKGTTYVVAAGNSAKDASTFFPANQPNVVTVSALADFDGRSGGAGSATCRADQDDTLADFSNFGSTVEIAAPGVCITSTWPGGGLNTISGTSMASPHVTGAIALLRSTGLSDAQARSAVVQEGNSNWNDTSGDGVKEPLLDISDPVFAPAWVTTGTGGGGGGGGTGNVAPTASIDSRSCGIPNNATCSFTGSGDDTDGVVASLAWNLGNGQTASGGSASTTYTGPGTYTVTLTATDDGGATGTATATVSCAWSGKGRNKTLNCTVA